MKLGWVAIAGILGVALASPVAANIQVVDFEVAPGGWFGFAPPYGLPAQPTLTGSVTIDSSQSGNAAFVGLNYTTGSRTWTLADIITGAFGSDGPTYNAQGVVDFFSLELGAPTAETYVITNNTAGVDFNLVSFSNGIACNSCVSITSVTAGVPEPSIWATMLLGFGLAGTFIRRGAERRAERNVGVI